MPEENSEELEKSRPLPQELKNLWIYKGVNIGTDGFMRCPHCNWILAEGKFPDSPLKFICPKCNQGSEFIRLT